MGDWWNGRHYVILSKMDMDFQKWHADVIIALGGVCVECGSINDLQIDHIIEEEKNYNISSKWRQDTCNLQDELSKCQVLCKTHHKLKTAKFLSNKFKKNRDLCHGTLSQYSRYKCRCLECKRGYSEWKSNLRMLNGETKCKRGPYKSSLTPSDSEFTLEEGTSLAI